VRLRMPRGHQGLALLLGERLYYKIFRPFCAKFHQCDLLSTCWIPEGFRIESFEARYDWLEGSSVEAGDQSAGRRPGGDADRVRQAGGLRECMSRQVAKGQ